METDGNIRARSVRRARRYHRERRQSMSTSEILSEARSHMDKTVKALAHEFTTVRTGRASRCGPREHPDRLLRHAHADHAARRHQDAGGPAPRHRAVGQDGRSRPSRRRSQPPTSASRRATTAASSGCRFRSSTRSAARNSSSSAATTPRNRGSRCATSVATPTQSSTASRRTAEISEDERDDGKDEIQKMTDAHVHEIDEALKRKEVEIMEV